MPVSVDQAFASPGRPLEPALRRDMEQRFFGHDFSRVRVHTDSESAESARSIGARAYTAGRNIYSAAASSTPPAKRADGFVAHELTHTLQQGDKASRLQRAPAPAPEPAPSTRERDPICAGYDHKAMESDRRPDQDSSSDERTPFAHLAS